MSRIGLDRSCRRSRFAELIGDKFGNLSFVAALILPTILELMFSFVLLLAGLAYFAYMEGSEFQATIGKKLLGLKVVDATTGGGPIGLPRGAIRTVSKILSAMAFFLGFIWVAFSPRKQGWHDLIAQTQVVRG